MDYNNALHKLQGIQQEHLLNDYYFLPEEEQKLLLREIDQLQIDVFKKQQEVLKNKDQQTLKIQPLTDVPKASDFPTNYFGMKLLREGKVGCLLVAGGQGTRLNCKGPKGTIAVSVVKKKSLFQIFAENVLAAGKQFNRVLPVAIMTSLENDRETKEFFEKNHYFGLRPDQISFFTQASLPFLNQGGNLFLENRHTIAKGPDGNGGSLEQFYDSGIWNSWHEKGISFVHFVLVDNPLERPFDPDFLSFEVEPADVIIKAIRRNNPKESVGILVKQDDGIRVVEYSEINEEDRFNEKHCFANISLFLFSMDFIQNAALREKEMPLHKALKSSTSSQYWKFEKFIFDVLPFANKVKVVEFDRKICFSPLKNLTGDQSLKTVQYDMQMLDTKIFNVITKCVGIRYPFEIARDFYYPTEELMNKWEGKYQYVGMREGYVEP
jgi:UDP-N-acetylglucosamine/UDP-N-acetylgalactosamine diphosphorylase